MVVLNRIYTRTGDGGSTRLASGQNVSKASLRVSAYGEVDELNAVLGVARLRTADDPDIDPMLARIQNDLFDLGADLATPVSDKQTAGSDLRIVAGQVGRLESEIDRLNDQLSPLTSFVLPGGTPASAALHVARATCRRAERAAVLFIETEAPTGHTEALRYLNRLSDLLFVAARFVNAKGPGDVLWVPAAHR